MDWGADRTVLLRLYRSLIRSKLDYGCCIWSSARKSYLKKLEPIQNRDFAWVPFVHPQFRVCMLKLMSLLFI